MLLSWHALSMKVPGLLEGTWMNVGKGPQKTEVGCNDRNQYTGIKG